MKEPIPFIQLNGENKNAPLYRQIYEAIRAAILSGEFASGIRLPSSRNLAQNLGVSRITVTNAYEQLFAEGYLEGVTGAGTFVAAELPDDLLRTVESKSKKQNKNPAVIKNEKVLLQLSPFGEKLATGSIESVRAQQVVKFQPFQNGLTAIDKFPFEIWSRIAARINRNPPRDILGYGDPQGFKPLREAIAAHLKSARGVVCTPDQIVITSGAQQALDLTARIFLGAGDAVLMEDPRYLEAGNAFAAMGAKVIPVAVDAEGFDAVKIPAALKKSKSKEHVKLVYVTPSHQYPLGVTMTLARRLALIEWARANNAWIIEDDYNSEFRYAGRPLASLQGLDANGRVIYIGTFSKTIFPSLRIGCAVVPSELVEIFVAARALSDVHSSLIDQAILTEFIREGHFARHIRWMRQLYEERQKILLAECEKHLNNLLEVEKADAGMHLVGWLPEGVNDQKIAKRALTQNLKISPLTSYFTNKPKRGGFILGYTAFDEKQTKAAVKKLKEILSEELG